MSQKTRRPPHKKRKGWKWWLVLESQRFCWKLIMLRHHQYFMGGFQQRDQPPPLLWGSRPKYSIYKVPFQQPVILDHSSLQPHCNLQYWTSKISLWTFRLQKNALISRSSLACCFPLAGEHAFHLPALKQVGLVSFFWGAGNPWNLSMIPSTKSSYHVFFQGLIQLVKLCGIEILGFVFVGDFLLLSTMLCENSFGSLFPFASNLHKSKNSWVNSAGSLVVQSTFHHRFHLLDLREILLAYPSTQNLKHLN